VRIFALFACAGMLMPTDPWQQLQPGSTIGKTNNGVSPMGGAT
jgi:hypothetical protein